MSEDQVRSNGVPHIPTPAASHMVVVQIPFWFVLPFTCPVRYKRNRPNDKNKVFIHRDQLLAMIHLIMLTMAFFCKMSYKSYTITIVQCFRMRRNWSLFSVNNKVVFTDVQSLKFIHSLWDLHRTWSVYKHLFDFSCLMI